MSSNQNPPRKSCSGLSVNTVSGRDWLPVSAMEDMVLIDILAKLDGEITLFTLDTGRLHEETYEVMERARSKYGITIQTYFPDKGDAECLLRDKGFFSFRESVDNRKECCAIRKIEPLNRALAGLDAWVTGLRREQNVTRTDVQKVAEDSDRPSMVKINPLADWSLDKMEEYIKPTTFQSTLCTKKIFRALDAPPAHAR